MGDGTVRGRAMIAVHWASEVACRPWSLALVVATTAVDLAASVLALTIAATTLDSGLFAGLTLLILSTGIALVSWCLLAVVRLSTVVARLEAQQAENIRRLDRIEDR